MTVSLKLFKGFLNCHAKDIGDTHGIQALLKNRGNSVVSRKYWSLLAEDLEFSLTL